MHILSLYLLLLLLLLFIHFVPLTLIIQSKSEITPEKQARCEKCIDVYQRQAAMIRVNRQINTSGLETHPWSQCFLLRSGALNGTGV